MQSITYLSLFTIGFSYGATACMFSCMPFVSPLLVNSSNTIKESVSVILPFSLGRIFAYTSISLVALSGAGFVKAILDDNTLFQILLGVFTLFMGLTMLYNALRKNAKNCSCSLSVTKRLAKHRFGLFGIGFLVSINPCAPVLTLIALSANSATFSHALGMGVSFGLGAVLIPFLFYGFFLSGIIKGLLAQFRSYTKTIEIAASLLLVVVALLVINGHISL